MDVRNVVAHFAGISGNSVPGSVRVRGTTEVTNPTLRSSGGRERKLLLIEMLGFACCHCGYARNSAALEFHHVIPGDKGFALDLRALSDRRWQSILSEVGKCILLCSNCHAERHNPGCALASKADATVTGGV